ncbi:MAG: hypothetical protein AAB343_03135 [Patescibacteria group bacterium]
MKDTFAQITSPIKAQNIPEFIQILLDQALPIVLGVAVIFIMYGGFTIAKAGGSDSEYSKGKQVVMYAVIGLLIVVAAKAIVDGFLESTGLR